MFIQIWVEDQDTQIEKCVRYLATLKSYFSLPDHYMILYM